MVPTGQDGRSTGSMRIRSTRRATRCTHSSASSRPSRAGTVWTPSYGYGVAFPDGTYEQDAHPGAPREVAIDRDDMADLARAG